MQISTGILPERLALSIKYGTHVVGSPQSSRGTALLLIENKKVRTASVFGEEHEWQDYWACDLVWNEVTRKWIFGFLTYSLTSFEVNLYDIRTGLRSENP
jgi:hypothetical protein